MLTLGCSLGCSVGLSWAFLERLFGAKKCMKQCGMPISDIS